MLTHPIPRGIYALLVVLLAATGSPAGRAAASDVGAAENWASHGAAADESDYSRLDAINTATVNRLGLAWYLNLPGEASLEGTPLAVNGILYFTGSYGAVYAVDARSGKLLWKYDPQTWKHNPAKMHYFFAVNRGVAYEDGRIFSAALDGRLFALDANTGRPIWSVETTPRDSVEDITGAPRAFDGKVLIGATGADMGVRGSVAAYDAATGRQLWRFYTIPGTPEQNRGDPAMERAAATWRGEFWKNGSGGGVWDSITYDPELKRFYIGTANADPYDSQARSPGGGDNLYTACIVALDADTGKYIWHYQTTPRDSWDYDSTQQMTLADLVIGGVHRKVLMQAPKNGFFYVLDRNTGKLISAGKIGKVTWAERVDVATGRPVENPGIRFENSSSIVQWPSASGAHSWQSMSFSPRTGLVYIPAMQIGGRFSKRAPQAGEIAGGGLSMGSVKADPDDGKGALVAFDPMRNRIAWRVQHDAMWNGGTLATAGDLVFQGTADGYFSAYDARSGRELWKFNAGLGIIGAPMSFSTGGKQYVSVLVGFGGAASIGSDVLNVGWKWGAQPRRLLTFALDGKAVLPASPLRDMSVHALDDPKLALNPADVAAGHMLFMQCALCHGRDAVSAGAPAPDLRESHIALDPQSLWKVLHDGILLQSGMPRFETLSRKEEQEIYAYIRARARAALHNQS